MQLRPRHLLILILCLVVTGLLSSCDPMALPYLAVNRIVVNNETPYLLVSEKTSYGIGMRSQIPDRYFVSPDYGATWQEISSPPIEMPPPVEQPELVQLTECVPNNSNICYRISGKEKVEISYDGGINWQVDWKMALGRRKYMEKNPDVTRLLEVIPDTIPYDLGIVSMGKKYIVIVTMGNQGLLVKSSDGIWERRGVPAEGKFYLTTPLPFYATSLKDATQSLGTETTTILLATVIVFIVLSFYGWRNIYRNVDSHSRKKILWSHIPFFLAVSGILFLILLLVAGLFFPEQLFGIFGYFSSLSVILEFVFSVNICMLPVIGLIISWLFVAGFSPNRKTGLLAALIAVGYTLLFFVGTWLPFVLWAFGIIPIYEIALTVAVIIGIFTAILGFRNEKRMAILATR
jgi:hypothetical protein